MQLNPEQAAAAYSEPFGVALIEAGAGSGKTATLRERIKHLIEQDKALEYPGSKLLVAAFNKKVQVELEAKVKADLPPEDFALVSVKTFHSQAMTMVFRNRFRTPVDRNAKLETVTQMWKLERYATEWLNKSPEYQGKLDEKKLRVLFGIEGVRIRLGIPVEEAIKGTYNLQKKCDLSEDEAKRWIGVLRRFRYETGYLTMDDYLELAANLPTEAYRGCNFAHVLADELQDLNHCQRTMIRKFMEHARSFLGVGDPSQSIYSFTGADATIFQKMRADFPEARHYRLTTNYRSTPQILSLANEILEHEVRTDMKLQPRPDAPDGPVPLIYTGIEGLVEWINSLRASGYAWKEIQILYRARAHTPELETGLTAAGIPYHVADGSYFEQAVIQDLLCYMYLLYGKKPEKAHWMRTFEHVRFLGAAAAGEIWDKTDGDPTAWPRDMVPKAVKGQSKDRLAGYWRFFDRIDGDKHDVAKTTRTLFDSMQEYWLRKYGDDPDTLEERLQVADSFCQWVGESGKTGPEIIEHIELVSRGQQEDSDADVIEVLTLHKSKGLESRAIAIWAVSDGNLPLYCGDPAEERRLMYVGATRAMEDLAIVLAQDKDRHGVFARHIPDAEQLVATMFDTPELADFLC